MKKYIKIICLILLVAFSATILFACNDNSDNAGGTADSNTIISGNPGSSTGVGGVDNPSEDNEIENLGTYIIYNIGDCPDAYMESTRQAVSDGQVYTLYMPKISNPKNSKYEFIGWKNAITGEMCENEGVFSGSNSIYLIAVWDSNWGPLVK